MSLSGNRFCSVVIALLLYLIFAAPTSFGQEASPSLAVSSESFVRIEHSTHPLATAPLPAEVSDAGRVEDGRVIERVLLCLSSSPAKQQALQQLLDGQQNPTSANYHHWLSSTQFGSRFGAEPADTQHAVAWLQESGLMVTGAAKSGRWIEFSGTARQINQAFRTELHYFQFSGKRYVANAADISLPQSIAQISPGLVSLNNFPKRPPNRSATGGNGEFNAGQKLILTPSLTAVGNSNTYYLSPGDFAAIYNTKPLLTGGNDGSGISIAIIGQSDIELTDVEAFRQIFQLKANDPNIILSGPDPGITNPIDQQEATLDTEWAGAVAPGATIDLVIAGTTDSTNGVDLAAAYAIENQVAPILTYTYGSCEQSLGTSGNAFYNALWQLAAAEGITVLVAAGDNGSAACDLANAGSPATQGLAVNGAASTPFNVAVGGTEFLDTGSYSAYWSPNNAADYSSALGYIPEAAWNESCDPSQTASPTNCLFATGNFSTLAGGGGASSVYSKPSWQAGAGVPADSARDVPDVALAAATQHDQIVYCNSLGGIPCQINAQNQVVGLTLAGGTSATTPAMAGILALVEQKNGAFQGQINYTLYKLAQTAGASCNSSTQTTPATANACTFYDVTVGSNAVPCAGGSPQCSSTVAGTDGFIAGQSAGPGYDLATGLGSVNATNLANNWRNVTYLPSQTQLQVPSTSFTHGTALTISGTVAPLTGSGTPTGVISLKTNVYGDADALPLTSGAFSSSVTDLPGGQYTLSAHYNGDGVFAASDSNSVTLNVAPEGSTTMLTALGLQGSAALYGSSVQLQVNVQGLSAAGIATGNITLLDGATAIGTYGLTPDGGAFIATGSGAPYSFPVGPHSLTASYPGDNSFNASTSAPLAFTIGKTEPLVIVGINQATVTSTQPLGAHVVVTGFGTALATGPVQFTVDGHPYGAAVQLQTGGFFGTQAQASLLITGLSAGNHVIGVNYDGSSDPNFLSVVNTDTNHEPNDPTVTVTAAAGTATTTSLTPVTLPVTLGNTGTFAITVSPSSSNPTGTVTLSDAVGARTSATPISGGTATIQFPWTQGGTTSLYAVYSGDATNAPSSSTAVTFTVNPGVAVVTLTAPAQLMINQQVSLVTSVTGTNSATMQPAGGALPYPTGVVEVWDSLNGAPTQLLTAQMLTVGAASTAVYGLRTTLPAGTHTLHSHYRGDNNWQPADSSSITLVSGAAPDFVATISPSPIAFVAGSSSSGTVAVTPTGGFTGNVALTCPAGSAFPIAGYTCGFTPSSTVTMTNSSAVTATLNLTPSSASGSALPPTATFRPQPGLKPLTLLVCLIAGLSLLLLSAWRTAQPVIGRRFVIATGWTLCAIGLVLGCGGGGGGGGGGPSKVPSTTALTSTNLHTPYQTPITFNVVVTARGTPSGSVTLLDNGQSYATATVSAGVATFSNLTLPVGVHTVTAQYSGDADTDPSNSAPITQVITGSVQLQITAASSASTHTATVRVAVN